MAEQSDYLHRLARGIIKIVLAPVVFALLSGINITATGTIGGTQVDLGVVIDIVKVFGPLFLLLSGLRDIGVRL